MSEGMQSIDVAGEQLQLLAGRAVYWSRKKTLIIADTHFGKAATFRVSGIPVPQGTTAAMLTRISKLINQTNASRLLILGDFIHSSKRTATDFTDELMEWRSKNASVQIVLVKGNHDVGKQDLFEQLNIELVEEPHIELPFAFCHYVEANDGGEHYTLAGHLHPAVKLEILKTTEKLPCFVFAGQYGILPAFGEFVGHVIVERNENQRVFVIADDEVLKLDLLVPQK